jgi:hypothetical protein
MSENKVRAMLSPRSQRIMAAFRNLGRTKHTRHDNEIKYTRTDRDPKPQTKGDNS